MMRYGMVVLVALLCGSVHAHQDAEAPDSIYFGGQVGMAKASFRGPAVVTQDGTTYTFHDDEGAFGAKIILGFRHNRTLAVELAVVELGEFNSAVDFANPDTGLSGAGDVDITIGGFSLRAVLGHDLGDRWRVFGAVGMYTEVRHMRSEFRPTRPDGSSGRSISVSDSGTTMTYGLGVIYRLADHWGLRADVEYLEAGDDFYLVSFGGMWNL